MYGVNAVTLAHFCVQRSEVLATIELLLVPLAFPKNLRTSAAHLGGKIRKVLLVAVRIYAGRFRAANLEGVKGEAAKEHQFLDDFVQVVVVWVAVSSETVPHLFCVSK